MSGLKEKRRPRDKDRNAQRQFWLGIAAISFYAIHAGVQLAHGRPENLLWACHAASLCVGIGLVFRLTMPVAVGGLLLTVGVPAWLINLAAGGEFFPTSILTHVGGLACAVAGLRRTDYPPNVPQWALVFVGVLLAASRLLTPAAWNVNLAFGPRVALDGLAGTWQVHVFLVLAVWAAVLILADVVLQRLAGVRRPAVGV